jgi:hypothetical protein
MSGSIPLPPHWPNSKENLDLTVLACIGPLARFSPSDFQRRQGMFDKRRPLSWLNSIAQVWLAFASPGCSEELGPEQMIVTRVTGVVRRGPTPVSGGWIEFLPVDGTVGKIRSARIRNNGSFEAEQVPVGRNLIRLANAPLGSAGAEQLFGSYRSPIRRTVPAVPTSPLVIDVLDEAILFKKSRVRDMAPESPGSGDPR